MSRSGRTPAGWRSTGLVAILLCLAGVYLLGRGLVPAVPIVYGGSEKEAAQRDAGLIQLALGCGLLALLGIVLARAGGRPIGTGIIAAAGMTTILGVAGLGWTYVSAATLAPLALGGTAWALKQWWRSNHGR